MPEAFIALLLTVNAAGFDNVNVERAFSNERQCRVWIARPVNRTRGKLACVSQREFRLKRNEVFQ